MASDSNVIHVEGLGKRYLKQTGPRFDSLREKIKSIFKPHATDSKPTEDTNLFWALEDINFSVREGEIVGIIGRNGAGKSTLLKILSKITAPTVGFAKTVGRVGSLLEVGTGFHPELTGRENIFLNGAILGMPQSEVQTKFDTIVDFAGVSDFLDMPVKRYSSGMYMRLAFAVAAHLEPDILVVDEVLAVGDADFQDKCLNRVKEISTEDRTVLFVSHNMNAIKNLCNRVILLENGNVSEDSTDVTATTNRYLFGNAPQSIVGEWKAAHHGDFENEYFSLVSFALANQNDEIQNVAISNDESVTIRIEVEIKRLSPLLNFGFAVYSDEGQIVFWSATTDTEKTNWPDPQIGRNILTCELPARYLNEGHYRIDFFSSLHAQGYFSEPGNTPVSTSMRIHGGLSESPYWSARRPGIMAPVLPWRRLKHDIE